VGLSAASVDPTVSAPGEAVAPETFREAMSRLAAAVCVITTDGPQGRAGFTATAVASVSDDPPTLLVCIKRSASVHPFIAANGQFDVHVLAHDQQATANLFGGKTPMQERFDAQVWDAQEGRPKLKGALETLHCKVVERASVATHDVFFARVASVHLAQPAAALLYYQRAYRTLPVE
jgi:flavin reductase